MSLFKRYSLSDKFKHVFEKSLTSVLIQLDFYSRRKSLHKWSCSYNRAFSWRCEPFRPQNLMLFLTPNLMLVLTVSNVWEIKKGFKFHSKLPYILYQAVLMLCCIDVVHSLSQDWWGYPPQGMPFVTGLPEAWLLHHRCCGCSCPVQLAVTDWDGKQ